MSLVPEDQRVMPETRPDTEAQYHKHLCRCDVCHRPESLRWRRKRFTS